MPAEPPREAGSSSTPSREIFLSAGFPHSEYCLITPGDTCRSTCAPASKDGNAPPSGSTSSRTTMPGTCSSRRATSSSSINSGSAQITWGAATGSENIADTTECFRRVDQANDLLIDLERSSLMHEPVTEVRGIGPRATAPVLDQQLGAAQLTASAVSLQDAEA